MVLNQEQLFGLIAINTFERNAIDVASQHLLHFAQRSSNKSYKSLANLRGFQRGERVSGCLALCK